MPRPLEDPPTSTASDRVHGTVLRRIVERFEDAPEPASGLRDEIVGSWQRSVDAGLRPERFDVPYASPIPEHDLLHRAAEPVLDRIALDLEGTRTGLLLADQRARIVDRRAPDAAVHRLLDRIELAPGFVYAEDSVGTNAIGTAIETSGPAVVQGTEHFADALIGVACSATPIVDPATGRVLGVVDLTSDARDASVLMRALVRRAAWEIEQRLLDRVSERDRALHEAFLRARRSTRAPLAVIGHQRLLVNGPAAPLLRDSERDALWDRVRDGSADEIEITLGDGRTVVVRPEPVLDAGRLIGALIRLAPSPPTELAGDARQTGSRRPTFGWESLSPTERSVATLVAEGLTNRETAARLVLSPHTIDFHLRHIFAKLDVTSRVELTRVVVQRQSRGGNTERT